MRIKKEELKEIANSLLFEMNEEEYDNLSKEFDVILEQMDIIGSIENLDNIEPMAFPYIIEGHDLREDEPSDVLSKEDVLKNSPDTMMDMVKVKKVVG